MGRADEVGSLEPGKFADFLVVDGDPLSDVTVLQDRSKILKVYQGGVEVASGGTCTAHPDLTVNPPNTPLFARH